MQSINLKWGFRWFTKRHAGEVCRTEEGAEWGLIRVPGMEVVERSEAKCEGWRAPQEQWELTTWVKGSEGSKRSLQHPEVQPRGVALIVYVRGSGNGAVKWKELFDGNSTFHSWDEALKEIERLLKMPFYFPGWQSRDGFTVFPFHAHLKKVTSTKI